MKKDTRNQVNLARRQFLATVKGVGALSAIAMLVGKSAVAEAASPAPLPKDDPPGSGYRETEHIRKYYRSARYW